MKITSIICTITILISFNSVANELTKTELSKRFQKLIPFPVTYIETSPMDGFKQIVTERGIFYVSNDGEHLITGTVHKFQKGLENLTEKRNLKIYSETISTLENDFITYRAPNEKHEVIIFYDISCGYCKKLHSQIAEYNAKGITVHYAAFPRQGVYHSGTNQYTAGFKELENIWCSDNKSMVFNMASRGVAASPSSCSNTIEKQYNLGKQLGVRGTPSVFAMNGKSVVTGYVAPDRMLQKLRGSN